MLRLAIMFACAAAYGCAADPSFHCVEDTQCGALGRCESSGYCSLEDEACPAGRRYEGHASELAGRCLDRYVLAFGERTGADVTSVTDDTRVDENAPANNFGIADNLPCNESVPRARSLLRFELESLPQDATIERAELLIAAVPNDGNSVSLYPILEAWTEGTLNNAPGAPNWTERAPSTPWASTALAGSPTIESAASATIPPSASEQAHTVTIVDQDRIRGWRDDPTSNHGWLLRSDGGNGVSFHSSEAGDASKRPMLRIQFRR